MHRDCRTQWRRQDDFCASIFANQGHWSKSRESDDPFKEARKSRRRGGACSASRGEGREKNRSYVWHADLRVGKREGSREEAVIGFRSQFEPGGLPRLFSIRC